MNEADWVSSSDRVVESIVRGIKQGRIVPGQRLVEADLTSSLGVSRGPVREALKRLAAEGLIALSRHRGAYVRAYSRDDAMEMVDVIEVLTILMARLAAKKVAMGSNVEELNEAFDHLAAYDSQDHEPASSQDRAHFYDVLIAIGGNRTLERIRPSMQNQLLRQQMEPFVTQQSRCDQVNEYALITKAVLAGDAKAAEKAMQRHMKAARERIERMPDEAFAHDD